MINPSERRITHLDNVRGIVVLLACLEHFLYFINVWYVEFFTKRDYLFFYYDNPLYEKAQAVHSPWIGKFLPIDSFSQLMTWFFIPWVSQFFIALACFNLARRTQLEFQQKYFKKLKGFGILLVFFIVENFVVATDLGDALSFRPIMAWMIVLMIISTVYYFFGIKGVSFFFLLSFIQWLLPFESWNRSFELMMQKSVHPWFQYGAPLNHYFTSASLGFCIGFIYFQRTINKTFFFILGILGLVGTGIYFQKLSGFHINPHHVLETEYLMDESFLGSLGIYSIELLLLMIVIYLDRILPAFKLPIVNWSGRHSLLIFAIHKIVFLKILAPIRVLIGTHLGFPVTNTSWEMCFVYLPLVLLTAYLIKSTQIHRIIVES